MTARKISLGAPYRWLGEAFAMCRAQPRIVFGAASLLMMVALLPSLLQLLLEAALQPSATARLVLQALFSVASLIVFPPLVGGFYRLVHALHQGRPASPLDLFAMFRDTGAARQLIFANLSFILISIVLLVGPALAFGGEDLLGFLRAMATLQPGATALPPFPDGLMSLMAVLLIVALVIMTAQGLATAQIAVTGTPPFAAIGAGFGVALRNVGAFLLFYLPLAVLALVVALVFILVAVLVGAMLSVISPMLAAVLVAPLSLLLVLLAYALMFTFFYHAWRDTLGSDEITQDDHQIVA
jgi:hypothetical protein